MAKEEQKFKVSELIEFSDEIFNCEPFVIAGALHGIDEITKSEALKLVEEWLTKPLNVEVKEESR